MRVFGTMTAVAIKWVLGAWLISMSAGLADTHRETTLQQDDAAIRAFFCGIAAILSGVALALTSLFTPLLKSKFWRAATLLEVAALLALGLKTQKTMEPFDPIEWRRRN